MSEKRLFSPGKTFTLGFGFLGVSVIWAMYNAYVPIFLKESFYLQSTVTGFIMTIDNIFAILLLPYLGALSDRTKTRLGRRRPYILFGAPIACLFFIFIPYWSFYENLGMMMLFIILMNGSMSLFRSPVIALMPDITPSKYRSQANGIINFMGGLGSLLVYFAGKPLYDNNASYPFIAGGILMFLTSMVVVIFIKEAKDADNTADNTADTEKLSFRNSIRELTSNLKEVFTSEKSLFFILCSILCWFTGYNAVETFFTSYARYYLGMKESTGAMILGFFSLAFMLTAILSGIIGGKIGRKKTIRAGLFIVMIILVSSLFLKEFVLLIVLFIIGGFGWALVNVNSLPMVLDMTDLAKAGGYTGLYYFFSQAANIIAPPLSGFFIDRFGYPSLMLFAAFFYTCAVILLQFVKRGETNDRK